GARAAYTEAQSLYKAIEDRLGEAGVLQGLGDLEHKLGRNAAARTAYAQARSLYKAVESRQGEANVLLGLARLEAPLNPELARQHYYQAAGLYEALNIIHWRDTALREARELTH